MILELGWSIFLLLIDLCCMFVLVCESATQEVAPFAFAGLVFLAADVASADFSRGRIARA